MPSMSNEKTLWKRLLIVLILPAALNFLIGRIIYSIGYSIYSDRQAAINMIMAYGPFYWSALHLLFFFLILNFLKKEGSSLRELIGLSKIKKDIPIGIGVAFAWIGIIGFYLFLTNLLSIPFQMPSYPWFATLFFILVTPITAGFVEEIVWRGYAFTRLEKLKGWKFALLIQAISFTLWHVNVTMFPYLFLIGLTAGFVYVKLRRLAPLIVGHWLCDLLGGLAQIIFS